MSGTSCVCSWRTAFLTLRDETLTPPTSSSLPDLLRTLLFSQTDILIAAVQALPPREVTLDVMHLVESVATIPCGEVADDTFVATCHLVHDISYRTSLEMNPSSSIHIMEFLENMLQLFLCKADKKTGCFLSEDRAKATMEILEIIRNCSFLEDTKIIKLLLKIVSFMNAELSHSSYLSSSLHCSNNGTSHRYCHNFWQVQTDAFMMIGDALSRIGLSLSFDIWQSIIEVLRKLMDILASRSSLAEDAVMSRYYLSLLHCLHLVLSNPKGSFSEHVASFVTSLQMFFMYGLAHNVPSFGQDPESADIKFRSLSLRSRSEALRSNNGTYKPPHIRKRVGINTSKSGCAQNFSSPQASATGIASSDSELSDSDGSMETVDQFQSSQARRTAIICIQDLSQADSKSLSAFWTILLPTSDVLQPRKYHATLMTCLLFDPLTKTRMASASALASMLDGHSSIFRQVADYKESTKNGSFTTLSGSLGQILMQLHRGLLYLIQHETHNGLMSSVFKLFMLLISATPYVRMPVDLLPSVISTLQMRISKDLSRKIDQSSLLVTALGCLGSTLSTSPPTLHIAKMLQGGTPTGKSKPNVLEVIFHLSRPTIPPIISIAALQALRAVLHNYPKVMTAYWDQVSVIIYDLLQGVIPTYPGCISSRNLNVDSGVASTSRTILEKCIVTATKVLDECLRAASGFKGTDECFVERLLGDPFTTDCMRRKVISSAPAHEFADLELEVSQGNPSPCSSGVSQWHDAIEKHLPLTLSHSSPMVRAASINCFAGITSSVFFSLTKEKQNIVLTSIVCAALNDEAPSVKAAGCRAIGVISCFPQIFASAEILDEFIHAAEINTHHHLVMVRVTATWALANICDSLRHRATCLNSEICLSGQFANSDIVMLLANCALRLTKDGDKIKSNAVRALGNLSRFVRFTTHSSASNGPMNGKHQWLETMVQAFVSCIATGNVKVQWNVCHALSNLFLNETLRLEDMSWASSVYSILLLLLHSSTNFKIRIHAATALAVPSSRHDYGSSFLDVIQGVEHILENLTSEQVLEPSNFKYREALEKQLTSTALHIFSLTSSSDSKTLEDFLVQKAPFLEDWFKQLCSSLECEVGTRYGSTSSMEKKEMVTKAIGSLLQVYESGNHPIVAQRFKKIIHCL